jgi:hypothetical protein
MRMDARSLAARVAVAVVFAWLISPPPLEAG